MLNFKISEFNITGQPIPEEVADDLLHYHMIPGQIVSDKTGIDIYPSQKSSYRPVWWEKQRRRSGNSQHTFKKITGQKERGATDWTSDDFKHDKEAIIKSFIEDTNYTRIAIYNTFLHTDYKPTKSGKRELYQSDAQSNWKLLKYV